MYSTCLFCHSSLGANESIEHFPVGRRLVFDAVRGRLWVVCKKCERWNLSPIEERWEAIEECERLFVGTRLRVSTDNIGLTRLREGLELVRIGAPLRPEMASWRYGDQFGRRRKRHLIYTGAGFAALGGLIILGPVTGIIAGSGFGMWNLITTGKSVYDSRRVRARIKLPEYTQPVTLRRDQLNNVTLIREDNDWALRIPFQRSSRRGGFLSSLGVPDVAGRGEAVELTAVRTGDAALQAAAKLLPAINAAGATRDEVDSAVQMIGEVADPASLFARHAGIRAGSPGIFSGRSSAEPRRLMNLPKSALLALEMATHEGSERRALEGELALLQEEWQRAEEIAAISDDMFVSDQTRDKLAALKKPAED
jgi:hypothetical protein